VTDYSRPMLKRVLHQADLMDRVREAIGVSPTRAARIDRGMAWYEARSRCIDCLDDRKCRAWVVGLDGKAARLPAFCRNAEFFRLAKQSAHDQLLEDGHEPRL
jgi:hypothetical protein